MKPTATYKKLTAFLMLLLYVSMLLPARWLHHHTACKTISNSAISNPTGTAETLTDAIAGNYSGEECHACIHKYATHDLPSLNFQWQYRIAVELNTLFFPDTLPRIFAEVFSSRGPPVV